MKHIKKSVCESKNFEKIFIEYFSVIRNYVYYKGYDYDSSEDIAQDAFVTLWNNCSKIDYDQALFYLKRVASNNFLNKIKHEKIVLEHSKTKSSLTNNESPDFIMQEKEFMEKLQNVIAGLTSKQREVFLLNRIDKKTYNEIAVFLNISVKAVEKRMHNALVVIREKIGNI